MSPSFLEPSALWSWVPGVAYGLGLFIATKRWSSSVLLPVSFVSVAALYHLGLAFLDISGNDAKAMGLLFPRISQGGLWPAFEPGDLAQVDWAAVAMQIPNVLALILVVLISVVMYLSGIELAANVELEWNREFKARVWAAWSPAWAAVRPVACRLPLRSSATSSGPNRG